MFANNHHDDGHVAVWLPAPVGAQEAMIASDPVAFFRPPYVGHRGWIGVELDQVSDDDLVYHVQVAWELVAPRRLQSGG